MHDSLVAYKTNETENINLCHVPCSRDKLLHIFINKVNVVILKVSLDCKQRWEQYLGNLNVTLNALKYI